MLFGVVYVFLAAFIALFSSFIISSSLQFLSALFGYQLQQETNIDDGFINVLIVAPIVESILLFFMVYLLRVFLGERKPLIGFIVITMFFSMHFNVFWFYAFTTLPLFAISILSLFYWEEKTVKGSFFVILSIHVINNMSAYILDSIY
ncbi:MAG: hypothetical protein V5788_09110 [Shewanella sp.]